jgi:hypothetical protein
LGSAAWGRDLDDPRAALWPEEFEAQLLAAIGRKWRVLGEEFEEDRADAIAAREAWPAGGSWLARARELAKTLVDQADQAAVERELAELRQVQ